MNQTVDILSIQFILPKRVYILAPGFEGREHFHRIPDDEFVIAVNGAIMIDEVPNKHIWMAEDTGLMDYPWFCEIYKGLPALGLFLD